MSKLMYRFMAAAVLASSLAGCTSLDTLTGKAARYDDNHSLAYNISVASGMDPFYDAAVSPEVKTVFSRTDFDLTYPPPADGTFNQRTTSFTPLLQPWIAVGFRLEDWQKTGILAWVPSDRASSPEVASKLIADEITKAVKTTLSEMKREYKDWPTAPNDPGVIGGYIFQEHTRHYVRIKFSDPNTGCEAEGKYYEDGVSRCLFFLSFTDYQKLVPTPQFLPHNPSGKSYLVGVESVDGSNLSLPYNDLVNVRKSEKARLSYSLLQRISKHLPSWIFFHISQRETIGLPAFLLQQGKVYFFIRDAVTK